MEKGFFFVIFIIRSTNSITANKTSLNISFSLSLRYFYPLKAAVRCPAMCFGFEIFQFRNSSSLTASQTDACVTFF